MSRTVSSPIPVSGQAQSYHSTSMSGPRKTRSSYSVAARLTERMCSSAVAEEILSSLKDFAPESLRYRCSMPNIFESPSKDLLTVSPTTTISMYDHSPLRNRLICTSLTGMDTDAEVFSETSEEPIKNSGRRPSTKKQPRSCDDDSNSSSTTSSIFSNRKRVHRSSTVGKRLKTTDSSRFLCVEKRREESISSAGELERFFDSMGLEDQTAAQRLRNQRLHVQVSDDAMEESDEEDQEEALESISVMGEIKLANSVDTDDDEPDSPRQTVTLGGRKDVMKKTPSMEQNTRIYEWLVNCRPVNEK